MTIRTSVPQGSILGPLLFLIYVNMVNDRANVSNLFHFILFAHDTSLVSRPGTLLLLHSLLFSSFKVCIDGVGV